VELGTEQHAVGLEVNRGQNEEAPHREQVRDAGNRPLQQLGLAEDLFDLVADPLAKMVFAAAFVRRWLAGTDQRRQPSDSLRGEQSDDGGHGEADDEADESLRVHGVPLQFLRLPVGNLAVVTSR
jgi:hypothetical protein